MGENDDDEDTMPRVTRLPYMYEEDYSEPRPSVPIEKPLPELARGLVELTVLSPEPGGAINLASRISEAARKLPKNGWINDSRKSRQAGRIDRQTRFKNDGVRGGRRSKTAWDTRRECYRKLVADELPKTRLPAVIFSPWYHRRRRKVGNGKSRLDQRDKVFRCKRRK